jgi:hypothetical protein
MSDEGDADEVGREGNARNYIKSINSIACRFEMNHGTEAFLKACMSGISKTLVNKGVCTEEELQNGFLEVINDLGDRNE